ncbi:MAG: hypothetical protein ACLP5J_22160 [Mycobacterium sp.]|jgi:hypothetical protein|uniref:hypothetical protein n=1 Tax=Mycobacterium sp. TaxID=1785 RepID=UPI003F956138
MVIAVRPIGCNGGVTGNFARIVPTSARHRESLRRNANLLSATFLGDHTVATEHQTAAGDTDTA